MSYLHLKSGSQLIRGVGPTMMEVPRLVDDVMPNSGWVVLRLILVALGGVGGWVIAGRTAESDSVWWSVGVAGLAAVLIVILLVGVQAGNPQAAKPWRVPSWRANPFASPLQFFHLCAWHFLAGGLTGLTRSLVARPSGLEDSLSLIAVGSGLYARRHYLVEAVS